MVEPSEWSVEARSGQMNVGLSRKEQGEAILPSHQARLD